MPTAQLTISQLLAAGFETFKSNSKSVVALFVGAQAFIFLLTYLLKAPFLNILMIPVVIFMQIALLKSYKNPYKDFDVNEILNLKDADLKGKIWKLLWTYVLFIILIILMFLTIIGIPVGIFFMVYWYFFAYVILDQGLSGMKALKKSKEMLKGHWWKTFALFVIAALLSGIISSIVTSVVGQDVLIGGLLMAVTSGLVSIYFGYVAIAYYFNLKK